MTPRAEAVVSNSLDQLIASLLDGVAATPDETLVRARVLVPEHSLRAWLCHKLSEHGVSLLRVEVLPISDALSESFPRDGLLPLLISFLEFQKDPSTPVERYRLAKRLFLPFALQMFLKDKRALASHPDGEELWEKFNAWKGIVCDTPPPTPLFLFGFSSLHPQLTRYFFSLPCLRALYMLSPCMLFWGDQPSDHEANRLLFPSKPSRPSMEQLEAFLDERHRLLANSGQVGREFLSAIEDTPVQVSSRYVFPDSLLHPPYEDFVLPDTIIIPAQKTPSLLSFVKADLLTLVSKRTEPCCLPRDRSIEIHAAPTVLREIEALHERLGTEEELPPASVLVLATDLRRYTAAIEQVFGKEVPYQVWGETNPSGAIAAFRMLIALLQSKGSRTEWIQLIRHPVFQRAIDVTEEEADALIDWLNTRPTQWGLSLNHKRRYLEQRAIPSTKERQTSFADDRDHLLSSFLSESAEPAPPVSTLPAIGAFLHFLQRIETWWSLPLDPSSFASLSDISSLLSAAVSALIGQEAGGFEEEALRSAATAFSLMAQRTSSPTLPCAEALKLFDRRMMASLNATALYLRAPVIVAEFGTFQPFPAKLIAVVGANAGILPQYHEGRLFDRLDRLAATLPASNTFVDRYSFLEAVLCADSLFISYQSYAFELKEPLEPSSIVDDLLHHLDGQYRIEGALPSSALHTNHPLARPRRPSLIQKSLPPLRADKKPASQVVNLMQIERSASSPLNLFFADQFALVPQKKASQSLFPSPWEIQDRARASFGRPATVSNPLVERASKSFSEKLRSLSIPSLTRYDLHLLPTVLSPYASPTAILSPTISGPPEIFGSWPGLIAEGMVLPSERWERELFRRWPECSVRAYCAQELGVPLLQQAIILSKEEILLLPKPPDLRRWAEFTHRARTMAFPFTFETVRGLLDHPDAETFFRAVEALAEKEGDGLLSLYLHTTSLEVVAKDLPTLEEYATLLWSSFFSVFEAL